jgi:putative acetyltransferase
MAGGVSIRPEAEADVAAIATLVEAAFGSPVEARLVAAIRSSDRYLPDLALVAEQDGEVVGHVMVSLVGLRDGDVVREAHSLSPLAVAPPWQRRGIGAALVRGVVARAAGVPLIVLEGSPTYYGALGFESSVPHGIRITLPAWAPPEAAQVQRLDAYDPALRGLVVYPPAFDEATAH